MSTKNHFERFYSCPSCGRAIAGERRSYFTCPNCERALCKEEELVDFDEKYCGHCGCELTDARKEALAEVLYKVNRINRRVSERKAKDISAEINETGK